MVTTRTGVGLRGSDKIPITLFNMILSRETNKGVRKIKKIEKLLREESESAYRERRVSLWKMICMVWS